MLREIAHQAQRIFFMAAHFELPLIGFDCLQFSPIRSRRPHLIVRKNYIIKTGRPTLRTKK
jgi:hypothetical protein